jgi:hypothetical protein
MNEKEYIKSLVKEAKVYHEQGLLVQSKEKYIEILGRLEKSDRYGGHRRLIEAVERELESVELDLMEIDEAAVNTQMSTDVHGLIKRLFSFSEKEEVSTYKGAVALARFGQYEPALLEFQSLLSKGVFPVVAAKNIITCHLAFASVDVAVAQFDQWKAKRLLRQDELASIRTFLENLFEGEEVKPELPEIREPDFEYETPQKEEKKNLLFTFVSIRLENGPRAGEMEDFDVVFQSDHFISIMIASHRMTILNHFQLGLRLNHMEVYSPMAVLICSGLVLGKTKITSGPRRGEYVVDLAIEYW